MTRLFAVLLFTALVATGCFFTGTYRSEPSFQKNDINRIVSGKTTKQEVLDLLGPPIAVARKDQVMNIPKPDVRKEGSEEVQANTFFELFSARHALTDKHVIYYYYRTAVKAHQTMILFVGIGNQKLVTERLWILIDDRSGTVNDCIFRKDD